MPRGLTFVGNHTKDRKFPYNKWNQIIVKLLLRHNHIPNCHPKPIKNLFFTLLEYGR